MEDNEINRGYIPVPVMVAERISTEFDKEEVIIISRDEKFDRIHFTTFGKTASQKLEAARVSCLIRKYFFEMEVPDGEEAPIGFESFHWSNEKNDYVEKEE